jgi:hypothetical protein
MILSYTSSRRIYTKYCFDLNGVAVVVGTNQGSNQLAGITIPAGLTLNAERVRLRWLAPVVP